MTKRFLSILLFLSASVFSFSQSSAAAKFGYVDTDYILSQIPEYKAAQASLIKQVYNGKKKLTPNTQK
jgi:Skp family chaperone for outer membrane proteins